MRDGVVQVHAWLLIRELAAVEHGRPIELVLPEEGGARPFHVAAQLLARRDGARHLRQQAHRSEEGAEEDAGVGVAAVAEEGNEGGGLLLRLDQRFVAEEVGEDHVGVADAVAQLQVVGDAHAREVAPLRVEFAAHVAPTSGGCHGDGNHQNKK